MWQASHYRKELIIKKVMYSTFIICLFEFVLYAYFQIYAFKNNHGVIDHCDIIEMRYIQLIINWVLCLSSIIGSAHLLIILKRFRWLEYNIYKRTLLVYLTMLTINIMYCYIVFIANTPNNCSVIEKYWFVSFVQVNTNHPLWKIASFIYNACLFIIPFDYYVIHLHSKCDLF